DVDDALGDADFVHGGSIENTDQITKALTLRRKVSRGRRENPEISLKKLPLRLSPLCASALKSFEFFPRVNGRRVTIFASQKKNQDRPGGLCRIRHFD
ncbi:MAG: hypothetical protein ACYC9T_05325, partial [Trichloromonadaceae bacterium]